MSGFEILEAADRYLREYIRTDQDGDSSTLINDGEEELKTYHAMICSADPQKPDSHVAAPAISKRLEFNFQLFARATSVPTHLDTSSPEWQWFCGAAELRDRISADPGSDRISVSDNDLSDAKRTFEWISSTLNELLDEGEKSVRAMLEGLSRCFNDDSDES